MGSELRTTRTFEFTARSLAAGARIIANKGGTRSGKTYGIMQLLVVIAAFGKKAKMIDVVSESMPHLKRGALRDFDDILDGFGFMDGRDYASNLSDRVYKFPAGSEIRFFPADNWGKVKGSSRDMLFINECNRLPWETFRQLSVRTRRSVILDWNPDSEFWYELHGLDTRQGTAECVTTYKDNPYLTPEQVAEIEANRADEEWWKVYGLGQTGQRRGLVYDNWRQVAAIPQGAEFVARGLDFGFVNDPTAIVDVYKAEGGRLVLDCVLYRKGLTNDKIAAFLRDMQGDTIADSAEMKSITEIRNSGIRGHIFPAKKGADSIRAGIDILRKHELLVTQRSLDLVRELRNYRWREDPVTGQPLNVPVDKDNHALDAVRYVALNRLSSGGRLRVNQAQML